MMKLTVIITPEVTVSSRFFCGSGREELPQSVSTIIAPHTFRNQSLLPIHFGFKYMQISIICRRHTSKCTYFWQLPTCRAMHTVLFLFCKIAVINVRCGRDTSRLEHSRHACSNSLKQHGGSFLYCAVQGSTDPPHRAQHMKHAVQNVLCVFYCLKCITVLMLIISCMQMCLSCIPYQHVTFRQNNESNDLREFNSQIISWFVLSIFIRIFIYFQLLTALGNMSQTTESSADAAVTEGLDFFNIVCIKTFKNKIVMRNNITFTIIKLLLIFSREWWLNRYFTPKLKLYLFTHPHVVRTPVSFGALFRTQCRFF